jgi:phosphatidate cytidylyltransferase
MQTCKAICNPADNQYFFPTLWIVAGFLGLTLLLLLVIMRFNLRALEGSVLFHRWRVWAIIAPVYAFALFVGPLTTLLLVLFLIFQGLREYSRLVDLPDWYERILLVAGLLPAPIAWLSVDAFHAFPPVLLIAGTLEPVLLPARDRSVRHFAFAVLGWGYIAWFLAHIMLIDTDVRDGVGILLAIGFGTALSDVGAFAVGKRFGRHKMAPTLSPNKTWEGAVGNLLGAYAGVGIMAFALPGRLLWVLVTLLPIVIALGAIWGDLLESSIKREFGVKDAGTWLPGFGGLLDRIDSLIIVVPLAFYFLRVAG